MSFFSHKQELYKFTYGDNVKTFTSSNKDIIFDNRVYKSSRYIKRGKITNQGSNEKSPEMEIMVTKDNSTVDWFKVAAPYREIELSVIQVDPNNLDDFLYLWSGTILAATHSGNSVTYQCFSKDQLLDNNSCRFTCQYSCNHTLYFGGCTLDINDYSITTTITNIAEDGTTLTVASVEGLEDGIFVNGVLRNNSTLQDMMIIEQTGTTLVTWYQMTGLQVGDTVRLAWGCDRLPNQCHSRFNNMDNYAGEPFKPSTSPFLSTLNSTDEDEDAIQPSTPIIIPVENIE